MSSIDWLGEVNPSWGYAPLFTLGSPKKKSNKGMLESNLLSLSYGRIIRRNIESSDGLVPASYETYQIVEPGDTVLRFTDLQNDQRSLRSGLVEERGIITSAYLSFTPDRRRLNPAFFAHMMRAVDLSKVFYRMGSGVRQSLNWGEFSLMRLPLPPLETQQRIAGYLDRETAEIDAAVADLDKYVELLELRARTLIKQQLSGDHPQVKMGLLADAIIGITYSPNDVVEEGGTKVYRSGNVQDSRINRQNMLAVNVEIPPHLRFQEDDILMCSRNGSANLVGKNAIVGPEDLGHTWGAFMTVIRSDLNRYLFWFFRSPQFDAHRGLFSTSTINQLTTGILNRIPVPLPPRGQRDEIVKALELEVEEIDALIAESIKLRDLLLRRRSVLITEVVTDRKSVV